LLGVPERGRNIPGIAAEAHQRQQGVAIAGWRTRFSFTTRMASSPRPAEWSATARDTTSSG